jgi:hypothetical protein
MAHNGILSWVSKIEGCGGEKGNPDIINVEGGRDVESRFLPNPPHTDFLGRGAERIRTVSVRFCACQRRVVIFASLCKEEAECR